MLKFPNVDPVIFEIWNGLSITWYSLSYVIGIILGYLYFKQINKKNELNISAKFMDEIITWSVIGIVLGGRLGYVFFYDFDSYMHQPLEIFKTWKGGMSFHGGLIGTGLAIYLACICYKENFAKIIDVICCVAPIGILLGRIANFINGELYGKITDSPLGMVFPNGGSSPRYPTQLLEAFLEGGVILITQYLLLKFSKAIKLRLSLTASFLIQYSLYRFLSEFFREPDAHLGYLGDFTMGQILSLPMFIVGVILLIITFKKKLKNANQY